MRLVAEDIWTDAEWRLGTEVRMVQQAGGPLSLRERRLAEVCGSQERALRLLAAVARAERQLDALLEVRDSAPQFTVRPVPQRCLAASSQVQARVGRTANAPARAELYAAAVCAVGFAWSAINSGVHR